MDIKFSGGPRNSQPDVQTEKKKQGALVLLLFILVGGFAYLYFFTGLIKLQEAKKMVEAPAAQPQIVKMPLPPRVGETVKPKETAPAVASPKPAVPAVVASTPSAVKPVVTPAPAPSPAPVPAARPAAAPTVATPGKVAPMPAAPKPKEESKKIAAVKPVQKQPQPAPVADKKGKTAVAAKSKAKKPAAEGLSWSIIVGDYILEEALSADLGRVRKSGFAPIVKPGSRKKSAMNRLFVSEFKDRPSAASTLEKLQRLTSDAFVIEQGGKFSLYAGSYVNKEAATAESVRLKEAGYATTLKSVDIAIPTMTLSVGPFANKKAADAARGKLQSAGLKVTLSTSKVIQCLKK